MKIIFTAKNIIFSRAFQKDFKKLETADQNYIKKKLAKSFENTEILSIKKLINYPYAQYRIRIRNFRLLFSVDEKNKKYLFSHCKKRQDLY